MQQSLKGVSQSSHGKTLGVLKSMCAIFNNLGLEFPFLYCIFVIDLTTNNMILYLGNTSSQWRNRKRKSNNSVVQQPISKSNSIATYTAALVAQHNNTMARKVADRSTFLLSFRTLFLGGIFGYLFAVSALSSNSISPEKSSSLSATSAVLTQLQHRLLGHKASEYGDESSVSFSSLMKDGLEEAESQGEEEHEPDIVTLDTAVAVIVFFLITLTILFEYTKEVIEEAADRIMKPVIQGLFGELTVLGFLSIVTFLVTKLGWFSKVSEHLFGEDEEEELLETFEFVHYMLFFIMVFFVINVLVLVYGGQAMEETWRIYDTACRDVKYMAQLDTLSVPGVRKTTYVQYLCETLFPCRSVTRRLRSELQLFRGLRQEFVLERSVKPPFAPHASNQVEEDFNFGRYLSICLGHKLTHMVHLSNYTWIFLGAMTLVFYGLALSLDNSMEVRLCVLFFV